MKYPCSLCNGEGYVRHYCGEDTCCCLDRDDQECPTCGGEGEEEDERQTLARSGDTILPCPFCGAPASIEEIASYSGVQFSVGCDSASEAECMGYQSFTTFNTRKEAVMAWNRRPVPSR